MKASGIVLNRVLHPGVMLELPVTGQGVLPQNSSNRRRAVPRSIKWDCSWPKRSTEPCHRIGVAASCSPSPLYRVGRYAEALSLLEVWQREWERAIVSQVGQFLMSGWPVALLDRPPVG